MDDALRVRLDAIVGLLAVIASLLAAVVVASGGGELLVLTALTGFVFAILAWTAREMDADSRVAREAEAGSRSRGAAPPADTE